MPYLALFLFSLFLGLAPCAAAGNGFSTPPSEDIPEVIVDTMETVFGPHPGQRRNHSKGVCTYATFSPASDNARLLGLSRSTLFRQDALPAYVRFSIPGGNPDAPDTAHSPRGMAIQFQLPDDELHNTAMLNVPVFGAATPLTFLHNLEKNIKDPQTGQPDPQAQALFKTMHPDAAPLAAYLKTHNPPESYATTGYNSLHAFYLVDENDHQTAVKWRFEPLAGEHLLSDEALAAKGADFLKDDLAQRIQQGDVAWDMVISIGQDQDPLTDPTQAWPSDREAIIAGRLTLHKLYQDTETAPCTPINYDPLLLSDGFEPTDDPVLQARSPAYAISAGRRLSEEAE